MWEIMQILKYSPKGINSLLDLGMGKGQISEYFANKGIKVTGTGLELKSYEVDPEDWEKRGIQVVECGIECMPFENGSFDAVVASHILEHVSNMGTALQEIRRVLTPKGWLMIFIPHFSGYSTAGHINTGWNIGQLLYVLLLNGFDVKEGHFLRSKNSVCAFVQKSNQELPPLRGDRGDIQILNDGDYLPFKIIPSNSGDRDSYNGEIQSINWDHAEELLRQLEQHRSTKGMIINKLAKIIVKIIGVRNANLFSDEICRVGGQVNPKFL